MSSRVLFLSIVTAAVAACSLVLEPVPHRPTDGGATIDTAHDSGVTTDADRSDVREGGFPADVPVADAIEHDAVGFDAIDVAHADAPAPDATRVDAVTTDGTHLDAMPTDSPLVDAVDSPDPTADAIALRDVTWPSTDGAVPCVSDGDCVPFWCGCGSCPSSDAFTCESPTRSCMLGCATLECMYAQNVSCTCVGGFCQRSIGTLPPGSDCTASSECAPGLACCACGASGCPTTCVAADPSGGCPFVM